MGRLEGKIALITGIGGGMGRTAALTFAREGARVVGCDLFEEGAADTVTFVREAGGQIVNFAPVNLADATQAAAWIADALGEFGGADILYNNASSPKFGDVQDLSIDDWNYVMDNELNLVFYTTRRSGRISCNTAALS
jgi:meso-butanediol dehydrogenase/(S,S)-butanediol dehydrogenase/diacetyl reductase